MNGSQDYTLQQLSVIAGIPRNTLFDRFQREQWEPDISQGNGGMQYQFSPSTLPDDLQHIVLSWEAALTASAIGPDNSPQMAGHKAALNYIEDLRREKEIDRQIKELGLAKFAQLPEVRKREAEARYEILAALKIFITTGTFKKSKAISLFSKQYNEGNIDLPDWVYETLKNNKKLDRATLYRWENRYREQGFSAWPVVMVIIGKV